jgi:hypothetical protein
MRAFLLASAELKGGLVARRVISRSEEAELLCEQVKALRDQLQRELLAYGELRAQGARHEAIAKSALTNLHVSVNRLELRWSRLHDIHRCRPFR